MDRLQRQQEVGDGRGGVFSWNCTTSCPGTLAAVPGTVPSCLYLYGQEATIGYKQFCTASGLVSTSCNA
eukprot:2662469-Rhodomonas_salina.1